MFPIRKIKFRAIPPADGMARWSFENNLNDGIGGYNGSPVGSPGYATGKIGQALNLDGASYVSVANDAAFYLNEWSVSCWVYPQTGGGLEQGILGTRFGGENTYDIKIRYGQPGGTQVHTDIGTGSVWLDTAADAFYDFQYNTWYLVTQTVRAGRWEIYIDSNWIGGADLGPGTPLLMQPGQTMGLGNSTTVEYFMGRLDELYVFPFVLHDVDVSALYNCGYV